MTGDTPRSTARIGAVPLHAVFAPVAAVCLIQTLITDIVYAKTFDMMWADMSAWLLTAGLVAGLLAVITGLIDFFGDARMRAVGAAWVYGLAGGAALLLSILNAFVHSRDAYTSVVPTGLELSVVVTLLLLVCAWSGWSLAYRHGLGVRLEARP